MHSHKTPRGEVPSKGMVILACGGFHACGGTASEGLTVPLDGTSHAQMEGRAMVARPDAPLNNWFALGMFQSSTARAVRRPHQRQCRPSHRPRQHLFLQVHASSCFKGAVDPERVVPPAVLGGGVPFVHPEPSPPPYLDYVAPTHPATEVR